MKALFIALLTVFTMQARGVEFTEIPNENLFDYYIEASSVPMVVAFTASWCAPCQRLKATLADVAAKYDFDEVFIAWIDADANPGLKKYLLGYYPTVRTFNKGYLLSKSFTGSQSESTLIDFIDALISEPTDLDYETRKLK